MVVVVVVVTRDSVSLRLRELLIPACALPAPALQSGAGLKQAGDEGRPQSVLHVCSAAGSVNSVCTRAQDH